MQKRRISTGLVFLALTALGTACATKKSSSDDSSKASAAASGSAAPASVKVSIPTDGDPTVVAAIKKLSACERENGSRKGECAADEEWDQFRNKFVEEDDLKQTKGAKLTHACFSLVGDENDNVREAATECLSKDSDAVADKKTAILVLVGRLDSEKSDGVRSAITSAIESLDPVKNGGADEVLALAKSLAPRENASGYVRDLLSALSPSSGEPNAATVAFALELIKKGDNHSLQSAAADTLGKAKTQSKEACAALLGLIQTKKYPWQEGLSAMAHQNGACSSTYEDVVTTVLAKMDEGDGYDKGFSGADAIYLERMLDNPGFTADEKKKLLEGTEKRLKNEKQDNTKKLLNELIEKLKK